MAEIEYTVALRLYGDHLEQVTTLGVDRAAEDRIRSYVQSLGWWDALVYQCRSTPDYGSEVGVDDRDVLRYHKGYRLDPLPGDR